MRWWTLIAVALATLTLARPVQAVDSVALPFAGGQAVRIIQGYNGGTHQGSSRYGLDLVLASGGTSGTAVVAPIDGTIAWSMAPGAGNGCLAIATRDGSFSVTLCHVIFARSFGRGESIARGQTLGTVGTAGRVGNNGTPHVHLELHRGRSANNPVPFGGSTGLSLEGVDLSSQTGGRQPAAGLVSGNSAVARAAPAPAPRQASVAAAPAPAARAAPPPPTPAPRPAAVAPAAAAAAPQQQTAAARPAAAAVRAAVVFGTDACLKIRAAPTLSASVVTCVPDGTEVRLTGTVQQADAMKWLQIPDQGWASVDFLRQNRAVVAGTDSCLNVRDAPSTTGLVVTCLPEGTAVSVAETRDGEIGRWQRVDNGPNARGWVLSTYLN